MGDLMTSELSAIPQVQLLEREQIERIRREQSLSSSNQEGIRLGRELGADGVLMLGVVGEETNRVLQVRMVAVRQGVVLDASRAPWPVSDPSAFSQGLVRRFVPILPKLLVPREDALPLSVVNIRNAVQSRQGKELERQVTQLLIERLSREPQIFVLERRRLDLLESEKERQGGGEDDFWKGSVLVEGTLNRSGSEGGRLTADLRMLPPRGGTAVELAAQVETGNPVALVEVVASRILEALRKRPSTATWDAAAEAERYLEEAKWALKWGLPSEAQSAADAAWFLGKKDLATATLRVEARLAAIRISEWAFQEVSVSTFAKIRDATVRSTIQEWREQGAVGVSIAARGQTTDTQLDFFFAMRNPVVGLIAPATDALRIHADYLESMPPHEPGLDSPWTATGVKILVSASEVLRWFALVQPHSPEVQAALADLRLEARRIQERLLTSTSIRDSYRATAPDFTMVGSRVVLKDTLSEMLERQPSLFQCLLTWGAFWQDRPEDMVAVYRQWMGSPAFSLVHQWFWARHPANPRLVSWNAGDRGRVAALWKGFRSELGQSTNVLLRLEAKALEIDEAGSIDELKPAVEGLLALMRTHRAELLSLPVSVMRNDWQLSRILNQRWFDPGGVSEIMGSEAWREMAVISAEWQEHQKTQILTQRSTAVFRLQKEFLAGTGPKDRASARAAFPVPMVVLDAEQARALKPLLDGFLERQKAEGKSAGAIHSDYGTLLLYQASMAFALTNQPAPKRPEEVGIAAQQPPVRPPPAPASGSKEPAGVPAVAPKNLLVVRDYVPVPLRLLTNTQRGDALGSFQVMQVEPVGDRYWFDLRHENSRWVFHGGHEGLSNVWWGTGILWDPRNGTWKDIRYPAGVPASGKMWIGSTAWFRDSLYLSDWDTFQRWDPASGKWERLEPAWQDPATLQVIGDRLYGASSNAIVEILDSGRGVRILASNRRRPAASALDTLETFGSARVIPGPGIGLRARVGGHIHSWDGKDWKTVIERDDCWVWPGATDTLVTPPLRTQPWAVWRLPHDSTAAVEVSLPYMPPLEPTVDTPRSRTVAPSMGTGQDRIYDLPRSRGVVADRGYAYFYQDLSGTRNPAVRYGAIPLGGRHGYLSRVRMDDGRVERVSVLFDNPAGEPPSEVLDGFFGGRLWPNESVWIVFTAQEVIFWKGKMLGIWRIPRADLEGAFEKARE
jgi:hypothetical protein